MYLGDQQLHNIPTSWLASWVYEVVEVESPVHATAVARRIAGAAGIKRIGHRIQQAMDSAVHQSVRARKVRRNRKFLWHPDMRQPPLRDRSGLPAFERRFELIAPEEISLAVRHVVTSSYGIDRYEVSSGVGGLLGYKRITADMRSRIDGVVDRLVKDGLLELDHNHLTWQAQG